MAVTIRVTPRTIERTVLILLILVFMSSTIYYSYTCDGNSESAATDEAKETASDEEVKEEAGATKTEETKTETKTEETKTEETTQKTNSTSYKDVEITIADLKYRIKETSAYKKAVIDSMAFIIKNKMSIDLKGMKVKVYFWDSSSHESWQTNPKITLNFPTLKAGESSTHLLDTTDMIGIGNIDLTKTFKFEFVDSSDKAIKTTTTPLKIEE